MHPSKLVSSFLLILLSIHLSIAAQQLTVSPLISLIDQPLEIKVAETTPNQLVKLQATTTDSDGKVWKASGLFQTDEKGQLNLATASSLQGSYCGIDPMGLFWSMQIPNDPNATFKTENDSFSITLELSIDEKICASQCITRLKRLPEVKRIPIKKDGIIGLMFIPPTEKPLPLIITLSGSSGGFGESRAQLLASHGFAVLALGYFGMKDLPPILENIPLEYFENALKWIKSRSDIDAAQIGFYGVSRGAELSLILGCLFPDSIQAIVASLPSSVVYSGIADSHTPAWTYKGLPFAPSAPVHDVLDKNEPPIRLTPKFLQGLKDDPKAFAAAAIPVEQIGCPILLISGGDDEMWPSLLFAQQIKNRLEQKGSSISCTHLNYPLAGHTIGVPFLPSSNSVYYQAKNGLLFVTGGTPQDNDLASRDSWNKIIEFFKTNLKM